MDKVATAGDIINIWAINNITISSITGANTTD